MMAKRKDMTTSFIHKSKLTKQIKNVFIYFNTIIQVLKLQHFVCICRIFKRVRNFVTFDQIATFLSLACKVLKVKLS